MKLKLSIWISKVRKENPQFKPRKTSNYFALYKLIKENLPTFFDHITKLKKRKMPLKKFRGIFM
jgi:hypothetical protein